MPSTLMKNSAFNAAAGMTMLFTGIVSSILVARILGPEANGIVAFAFWLTLSGTMIAGLGSDVLLSRLLPQLKVQGYDERQRRGFAAYLATAIILATMVLLFVYYLVYWEVSGNHWAYSSPRVVVVTGVLFLVQSLGMLTINYLIGEQKTVVFFRLTTVSCVLQLTTVLLGALNFGVVGALGGFVVGQTVYFLYALRIILTPHNACGIQKGPVAKAAVIISVQAIVESIFLNRIEMIFLQQFHGVIVVGYYAIGLSMANLALQLPVQAAGSLVPFYTQQIKSSSNGKLPIRLFEDVMRSMAYLALPMGFGVAAISWGLVVAIYGDAFHDASHIVAILAIGAPVSVFMQISTKYLFAMDLEKERLRIGIIGAAIMVAGCLAVVPFFSGAGAAFVRLIVLLAMSWLMVRKMDFEDSMLPMFVSLAKITLCAALCAASAYCIVVLVDGFGGVAIAIGVAATVYVLCLRLFRAVPQQDLNTILPALEKLPATLRRPVQNLLAFTVAK